MNKNSHNKTIRTLLLLSALIMAAASLSCLSACSRGTAGESPEAPAYLQSSGDEESGIPSRELTETETPEETPAPSPSPEPSVFPAEQDEEAPTLSPEPIEEPDEADEVPAETPPASDAPESERLAGGDTVRSYVLNTNTKKFHYPDCKSVPTINENNRMDFDGTREEIIKDGYSPCKICEP